MLSVVRISKDFGAVAALSDVSVAFEPGTIHAICGENGAGKSTLIKMFAGVHQPDQGDILIEGEKVVLASPRDAQRHGIGFVAQELSICPDLSVFDNLWLGSIEVPFLHRRADLRERAQRVMSQLGLENIDLDVEARTLSLGQRQLIEIARALVRNAHTLILDEPTAALSDAEITKIFAALEELKTRGYAIVFVSHRLGEVFDICSKVTVMRNGREVCTQPVSELTREKLIEHMLGRSASEMFPHPQFVQERPGVEIRGLSVPGKVFDFSAYVPGGRILCVAGQVGSGSTDVIQALAGSIYNASGEVRVHGRPVRLGSVEHAIDAGIMLISGDRSYDGIFLELSVVDNLVAFALPKLSSYGLLNGGATRRFADRVGRQAGVDMRRAKTLARQLSGGNQQKLAFGRLLGNEAPGVLVMNEPTRGIDVGARAEIYKLMRDFCDRGHAVILASSDLEEVVGIADDIVTMCPSSEFLDNLAT